jgi:hypothetical protein
MISLIECMAKAIAERRRDDDQRRAEQGGCDINLMVDAYMAFARRDARVALLAARKPTARMVDAAFKFAPTPYENPHPLLAWEAMIDKALEP